MVNWFPRDYTSEASGKKILTKTIFPFSSVWKPDENRGSRGNFALISRCDTYKASNRDSFDFRNRHGSPVSICGTPVLFLDRNV